MRINPVQEIEFRAYEHSAGSANLQIALRRVPPFMPKLFLHMALALFLQFECDKGHEILLVQYLKACNNHLSYQIDVVMHARQAANNVNVHTN